MAGRHFAQATELGGSAEQLAGSFRANRQHLLYRLRRMQEELERWADLLESEPAEGEDDALLTALIGIEDERIEGSARPPQELGGERLLVPVQRERRTRHVAPDVFRQYVRSPPAQRQALTPPRLRRRTRPALALETCCGEADHPDPVL